VRPVLRWRDPEALLAWLNCRYGVFRWEWDLRHPDTHADFNRAVLADPRAEPAYHWLRFGGLANAMLAAGAVATGLAVLEHQLPSLARVSDSFLRVMFGLGALTLWRWAALGLVTLKAHLPRWLVGSSWAHWALDDQFQGVSGRRRAVIGG
jgi:hypothetical protein